MLRFAVPVCTAVIVLATGVGCAGGQRAAARTPRQAAYSFRVGSGTIVPATARGITAIVDGSRGSFRTLRRGTRPRVVLADDSADLDGDRLPDLVTHYNGEEDTGGCSEDSGVTVCTSWAYVGRSLAPRRFHRSRVIYRSDMDDISPLAAGDVTGDGRPDLVLPFSNYYGDNGVRVFVNRGAGRLVRRARFLSTVQPPITAALADLNGDGRLDLVTANNEDQTNRLGAGSVSVFLGGAKGAFGRRRNYRIGGGADGLVVRDLNADGRPDVVVSRGEAGPFVSVLLNRGGGTFGPKHDYRGSGRFALAVAVADVNEDGRPDLLIANGERGQAVGRGISVLLNRGRGAFALRGSLAPHARVLAVAVGDLNGDGREDLLVQTLRGLLVLLKR